MAKKAKQKEEDRWNAAEKVVVWREDRKAIKILGKIYAMSKYPVAEWWTKGSGKWKKSFPGSWLVPVEDLKGYTPISEQEADVIREKRTAAGEKAARTYRNRVDEASQALGLLPGSRTAKALLAGDIDSDEARKIADRIVQRHEDTSYDNLLAKGISREDARQVIQDELRDLDKK